MSDWVDMDLPMPNYPPFEDQDWRNVKGVPSATVQQRADNLVDQSASWHDARHQTHAHPWCPDCRLIADNDWEPREDHSYEALRRWVHENDYDKMLGFTEAVYQDYDSVLVRSVDDVIEKYRDRLSDELCHALFDYVEKLWNWECDTQNARSNALGSAMRYLTIHGRAPVDPWPYLPVDEGDSGLYLTRSELKELPKPDPLIDRVLPRHAYGLLTGRDGTFKSFVALDWACHLATGRSWLGRWTEPIKVLYIAAEGAYGIEPRIEAWEALHQTTVPDDHLVVRRSGLNLYKPTAAFDRLLERVRDDEYGLVVIDTLRRVSGGADGNGTDMGVVVDNAARIKDATDDGTVLVLAHTGKDDKDARGFSGIEDDADFVWHTSREDSVVTIENTKMKDGPDGEAIRLQSSVMKNSLVLVEAGTEIVVASESQIKLLGTLRELFPDGVSGSVLLDVAGLPKPTFYRTLKQLIDGGHVVKSGTAQRPFYTPRVSPESHSPVSSTLTDKNDPDQQSLTESHAVSRQSHSESHESHPPLGVRHETETHDETEDGAA